MTETFYDVLGVEEDATQSEITEAYRSLVKEYHPDVSDHSNAADRFDEVVQAEEVLGDEAEREKYDEMGHHAYLRRVEGKNVASTEHSPWTTSEGRDRAGESSRSGASADGGTASADPNVGFGTSANRQASADWTTTNGNDRWSDHDQGGYTVHGWDEDVSEPETVTLSLTQEQAGLGILMQFLYPVFLWFSVDPTFPLFVNLVVGLCTLLTIGYFLTLPKLGLVTFGSLSVLTPIGILLLTDWGFGMGLVATLACWVPFGYAALVAYYTQPS
jgi:hypothetical protein